MSFQDDAGPYTMVSHQLANEVGLVCAVVYGAVWRYCQMKEGSCRASLITIAKDININRATVLRSIEKLSSLGYLIDQTPDRRNAPHTYVLGRSVVIRNTLEEAIEVKAVETVAESNTVDNATVAYNNTSIETVVVDNATVAESYLNRDSNRQLKQQKNKEVEALPESDSAFAAVSKIWQSNIGFLSPLIADEIKDVLSEIQPDNQVEWFKQAIGRGCAANARTWRYIQAILRRWIAAGGIDLDSRLAGVESHSSPLPEPELPPPPVLTPEESTWQAAQAILQHQMTRQTYDDLLRDATVTGRKNGTFTLTAPNEQAREWIVNRLYKTVSNVLKTIDPTINEIEVMI